MREKKKKMNRSLQQEIDCAEGYKMILGDMNGRVGNNNTGLKNNRKRRRNNKK